MIRFTPEEQMIMMLYSPGDRPGLIAELSNMKLQLTNRERRLRLLAESVLEKLEQITDMEFAELDFYPDF